VLSTKDLFFLLSYFTLDSNLEHIILRLKECEDLKASFTSFDLTFT